MVCMVSLTLFRVGCDVGEIFYAPLCSADYNGKATFPGRTHDPGGVLEFAVC